MHALPGSLYKSFDVMGSGQSVCYLYLQELGASDSLYCCVVDEEWCMTGLAPPERNDDLLSFVNIRGHIVGFTPDHQMSHLLSVGHVVVIMNKAHHLSEEILVFFGTGIIVAVLKHDGTTAWISEVLKMSMRTPDSWSAHSLSNRPGMSSGPAAFRTFTLLKVLRTVAAHRAEG